jgi:hypothetical protein
LPLEKGQRVLIVLELLVRKNRKLVVRVVDFKKKPIPNVLVRCFKIEKESITPEQWVANLKNGAPFKTLFFSINTDITGTVTAELPEGTYEVKVEAYGFNQVCELTQNVEVFVIEPKKHWWQG